MGRLCRICNTLKPISEFRENGRKFAVENRCKDCISAAAWLRREIKKSAPAKPDNCECCGKKESKLCIDHCHDTLEFRGWICEPCNRGIGQLGDNIIGVQKALNYLQKRE